MLLSNGNHRQMKSHKNKIRHARSAYLYREHRSLRFAAIISLLLFLMNFSPLYAQEMYIDVIGGGYKISGPGAIILPAQRASFYSQTARADVRKPVTQDPEPVKYVEIIDENGGNGFSLDVTADDFNGPVSITKDHFSVKNCDLSEGDSGYPENCITAIEGQASWLTLDPATGSFTAFGQDPLPLAGGSGQAPGKWHIYPSFRLEIPGSTPPGQYSTTITFTIS
jgi:hypothetical protein